MSNTRTWPSIEEMRHAMLLFKQANPNFTWQQKDNKYYPCREGQELCRFEQDIFDGIKTPGFFPIRYDNNTLWGGVDFDNHHGTNNWLDEARRTFDSLARRFPVALLEQSSPGSFHVIPISSELIPACEMRRILCESAPVHPDVEIYPKQEVLTPEKPMGNCLRFPGHHQYKGCWSTFIDRKGSLMDVDVNSIPPVEKWTKPNRGEQLLSLYINVTRGLQLTGQNQRFNSMQSVVGRLKGKMLDGKPVGEKIAMEIHDRFYNEHSDYIETTIEESRRYFLGWFRKAAPCNVEIPEYALTQNQQRMIASLPKLPSIRPELLADTVRLILSAKKHADEQRKEMFLSLLTIARRLKRSIGSASNYRNACYKVGLIEMRKRGSSVSGKASTYKLGKVWLG